jgi:hypothetical protein
MDITTVIENTAGNTNDNIYPNEPQETDVPCRISMPNKDAPVNNNSDYETIEFQPVIFCDPTIEIPAGSKITVYRRYADGTVFETYEGLKSVSGRANIYETHQEFQLDMLGTP